MVVINYDEAVKQIQIISKEARSELLTITNKALATDTTIPDFKDVQNRRVLYEKYGSIVSLNDEIGVALLSVKKLTLSIKELRLAILENKTINYNVTKVYKDRIDKELESIKELTSSLTEYKQSLDATLRFYNSLQFILTTYKLGGDSYE